MSDDADRPGPDHIRSVFERYGALLSAGDTDGIVALFAPDAVVRDPVDGPEYRGHPAIRAFYQSGFDAMGGGIQMTLEGNVRVAGRHGAAAFIARTINHSEIFETDTLDVMRFDGEGRIVAMDAYWGPSNFRRA
ncbi:nuclear transport factor 2 family protein [Flavisphingomonas formosensis]|uniref:nuclear transport factor 2 family protein n=1 Tax=Flavisphingomonas formosensis TaxID=861534 RepID=UPI0012FC8EEA|nr:nuclear transport factor 2 family protein [Sphingomonas formosensis]